MPSYIWPVGCEGQCGTRKQARGEGSKSARKDQRGARYGLGEAIHCRPPPQRWPNCWAGSVDIFTMYLAKTCSVSSFICLVEDRLVVGYTYLLLYTWDLSRICLTKFLWDWPWLKIGWLLDLLICCFILGILAVSVVQYFCGIGFK
jgi:hypothetical protein